METSWKSCYWGGSKKFNIWYLSHNHPPAHPSIMTGPLDFFLLYDIYFEMKKGEKIQKSKAAHRPCFIASQCTRWLANQIVSYMSLHYKPIWAVCWWIILSVPIMFSSFTFKICNSTSQFHEFIIYGNDLQEFVHIETQCMKYWFFLQAKIKAWFRYIVYHILRE